MMVDCLTENLEDVLYIGAWVTRCCYLDMFQIKTKVDLERIIKEVKDYEEGVEYLEVGTHEEISSLGRGEGYEG